MENHDIIWNTNCKALALTALSVFLLLAGIAPTLAAPGFTVKIVTPPTVNVGEPTRIFVIFTVAGDFVPIDQVTIKSFQIFTPDGLVDIDPTALTAVTDGWYYVDFAPKTAGHYAVVIVASYDGVSTVATAAFSTTASNKILSTIASFREELLVYLEKEFIRTKDVLGSAIGETSAKLSAQLSSLDEKADAIIESIGSVIESIEGVSAGIDNVIKSIAALEETVVSGFSETTDALKSTIASSTDAIKASLRSSTTAIAETIRNSNDAITSTVKSTEGAINGLAEDVSSLVTPFGVGIALAVLFAAIAGIKQLLG